MKTISSSIIISLLVFFSSIANLMLSLPRSAYAGNSSIGSLIIAEKNIIEPSKNTNPIYLPIITSKYYPLLPSNPKDWPMLAANQDRTSWSPEEVRGNLSVEWYRPIEPYIHYKIQPIASNGRIFVSTTKGLYTFSAYDGHLLWVFPTEQPLGHSPTVASIDKKIVVYIGGYDRKIHALDAYTGQKIAGYTPYEADGGFETNPLVINNMIYAGNRDGYFYAINARSGNLEWRYKTDGPISFSAAYKSGIIYFASNDNHGYALDANNGSLIWKTEKFPGSGFYSFWPVIYTDKSTNIDYVIFTGGENYIHKVMNLVQEENKILFHNTNQQELNGSIDEITTNVWSPNTVLMDGSYILNYYQNRPDRRTVFVVNRDTGVEYTFDSNGDGKSAYAPFTWSGVSHSGSKYPPIINGIDNIYYQATAYIKGDWISRGGPVGWIFGSKFISRVHTGNSQGSTIGHASDEPISYSSGGRLIYWSLCCDRESGGYDVTIPFSQPGRDWYYFGYNLSGNKLAPGYQQMYNSGNLSAYNNIDGWQVYSGKNQSLNGVYGKHGSAQSPPIPYRGKLYILKGNALIAFSPNGTNPDTPLALAQTLLEGNSESSISKTKLTQRLENEIQKILIAGPLRPGYHPSGMIDIYGIGDYDDEREFGELFDYFQNPSDTVYTLLLAFPYLSSATQQQVKTYIKSNFGPDKKYDISTIAHVGWGSGAKREIADIPLEVKSYWGGIFPFDPSAEPKCNHCQYWKRFPPFSFYAAWKYVQIIENNDRTIARDFLNRLNGKLEKPPDDIYLINKPYILNLYIAGYLGHLELQKIAGYPQDNNVLSIYQHLLELRVNNFSKDTPYPPIGSDGVFTGITYNNSLAVARNFMFLTPELSDYLNQNIYNQVQAAINEYTYVAPYWFVNGIDVTYGEGTLHHLYDSPALFQAKAFILKEPYEELIKWMDVPAFYQGDLFYIQNLVAALNAD